jgi:hypothetical protein
VIRPSEWRESVTEGFARAGVPARGSGGREAPLRARSTGSVGSPIPRFNGIAILVEDVK